MDLGLFTMPIHPPGRDLRATLEEEFLVIAQHNHAR